MALKHCLPAINVLHISWRGFNRASIISSVPSNGKRQVFCRFFKYKELHVRKLFTSPCTDIKETETAGNRRLYMLHFLVKSFPSIRLHKKNPLYYTVLRIHEQRRNYTRIKASVLHCTYIHGTPSHVCK